MALSLDNLAGALVVGVETFALEWAAEFAIEGASVNVALCGAAVSSVEMAAVVGAAAGMASANVKLIVA